MKLDIVTILYNSEKWLNGYLTALENSDFPLNEVRLVLIDNAPKKAYEATLNSHAVFNKLGDFVFVENTENVGFGKANNQGANLGNANHILFLNIDTELTAWALSELNAAIQQSEPEVGAWEMRQLPYEHPKIYDPVTQYVSWASAAALCVKRKVFEQVGGFDDKIFMYGEDVDLSWAIRSVGFQIKYCPNSSVYHYSYNEADEVKPTQFYYSIYNNLMLRFKYGTAWDIVKGYSLIRQVRNSVNPQFTDQYSKLGEMLTGAFKAGLAFRKQRVLKTAASFKPTFMGFDYETIRKGAFYVNTPWQQFSYQPLVSIIVRTHKRPLVMECALKSLLNQTYPFIEVVVVEDGEPTAQSVIDKYKDDKRVVYYPTGINRGRSHAGNLGMDKATGAYLCFLDDDDLVYADHVETLVSGLQSVKHNMVHVPAFCVTTDTFSNDPYLFAERMYEIKHDYPADKEELLNNNLFPIQSVLFEKRLFTTLGGFDESIDYLEDWALWLKYAYDSSIGYIDKVTSLYRVPANIKQFKTRMNQLISTREYVLSHYAHNYIQEKNELEAAIDHFKELTPMPKGRLKKHIDLILYGINCIAIYGWAITDKKENLDKVYLKIQLLNKTVYYKLSFQNRRDIQRKFQSTNTKLGFKGDLQVLGISGFTAVTFIFVKDDSFEELYVNRYEYFKILHMARLRRFVHSLL
jgi:GT2 family glycosyltransferase